MKLKKNLRIALVVLSFVLALSLVSCGGNADGDDNDVKDETAELKLESVDISEYKLVRSDTSSAAVKESMTAVKDAIAADLGITLKVGTDYNGAQAKEIVIGSSKRTESKEAEADLKGDYDYIIRAVGEKVVIVAGTDETLEKAVDVFLEKCIDKTNKTLLLPTGDGIVYRHKVILDSLTIDGTDISEFVVVDRTADKIADNFIEKLAYEYAGVMLKKVDSELGHNIILDGSLLTYTDYEIKFEDGNVYINAGYHTTETAVNKFFEMLSAGGDLALTAENNFTGSVEALSIPYKNKADLLKVINSIYESDSFLMGEHLAGSMSPNSTIEGYYNAVGEKPSIIDFDMLRLKDYPRQTWSKTLCELVEFAAQGGVITTMHHWLSPIAPENGYRGNLGTEKEWREVITDGTELNLKWREELDRAGDFMKALNDAGVTFMYRPMHEVNGNWFWFCVGQANGEVISSESTVDMWKYVYNYYTDGYGIKDILWEYGPNVSQSAEPVESGTQPVDYYYPGEDYCDVVGYDWYTSGNYEIDNGIVDCHTILADLRHPVGIMEFGVGGNIRTDDAEIQPDVFSCYGYTEIFDRMLDEGKKLAFVEVYCSIFGSPTVLGHGEALANYKYIIHLEEMPELIRSILGN